jgi:hypothetical protein
MVTPVLWVLGSYIVIVGWLTSLALGHHSRSGGGPNDSGFGFGNAFGTVPGQMGTCTWPGDGFQSSACADQFAIIRSIKDKRTMNFLMLDLKKFARRSLDEEYIL